MARKLPINSCKVKGVCHTIIVNFNVKIRDNIILDKVNLHIHCGEITAIIGPNGAGKTTLMKALLGQIKHGGKLNFLDEKGDHTGKPVIGYVPQYLNFDRGSPLSVMDFLSLNVSSRPVWAYPSKSTRQSIIESLKQVQAEHLIDKRLGDLSGGELQRVLLSFALNPLPDILLLDEPISGVDEVGMNLFYDVVSKIKSECDISIILASHDLQMVAKYANRVVLLNRTIECIGTPHEVYHNKKFLEIFGNVWFKGLFDSKKDKAAAIKPYKGKKIK